MQIRPEEITQILKSQLANFEKRLDVSETGTVVTVGDGVAKVYGLEKAMAGELVDFGNGLEINARWLDEDMPRERVVEGLRPLLDKPVEHVLAAHGGSFDRAALERALA